MSERFEITFASLNADPEAVTVILAGDGVELGSKARELETKSASSVSKAAAANTIDALIGTITTAVTKGGTVQLIGFGAFSTGARAARVGRNPATGAEIQIPAAKTVKFTAGKVFKDAVNGA